MPTDTHGEKHTQSRSKGPPGRRWARGPCFFQLGQPVLHYTGEPSMVYLCDQYLPAECYRHGQSILSTTARTVPLVRIVSASDGIDKYRRPRELL